MYGLTKDIIYEECRGGINIQRALSIFISEGPYHYAGIPFGLGETLRARVQEEVQRINEGAGEDLIEEVLRWVRCVQIRALQDLAVCHAMVFTAAWCTVRHDFWAEVAPTWAWVMRTREEHDVGWVPAIDTPTWNLGFAAIRLRIQEGVGEIGEALTREDGAY